MADDCSPHLLPMNHHRRFQLQCCCFYLSPHEPLGRRRYQADPQSVHQHKRHQILSFHYVRGIISQGWINLQHLRSDKNASDPLTKHWGYQSVWKTILQPLFHHVGDTRNLTEDDENFVDNYCSPEDIQAAIHYQWGVRNSAKY